MTRRHRTAVALLLTGAVAAVFVLLYFQPQKLVIDDTVQESAPAAVVEPAPVLPSTTPLPTPPPGPTVHRGGAFRSGEHTTTGTVQVLTYSDDRRYLRLVDLRTSNGPKLKVWLSSEAPGASDGAIRKAGHADLGGLKGNIGSQNYLLPPGVDLTRYSSVVVWCIRFHVAFGSAALPSP